MENRANFYLAATGIIARRCNGFDLSTAFVRSFVRSSRGAPSRGRRRRRRALPCRVFAKLHLLRHDLEMIAARRVTVRRNPRTGTLSDSAETRRHGCCRKLERLISQILQHRRENEVNNQTERGGGGSEGWRIDFRSTMAVFRDQRFIRGCSAGARVIRCHRR